MSQSQRNRKEKKIDTGKANAKSLYSELLQYPFSSYMSYSIFRALTSVYRANIFLSSTLSFKSNEKADRNPAMKELQPSSFFLRRLKMQSTALKMKDCKPRKVGNLRNSTKPMLCIECLVLKSERTVNTVLNTSPYLKLLAKPSAAFFQQVSASCLQKGVLFQLTQAISLIGSPMFS